MDVDVVASNDGEPMSPPPPPSKKRRFSEEMNRVAEIVLVLSALGRMRGGKAPTEMELELMVEARSKLAEMCQEFTPKDIIGGDDDVRGVIEDLGLNCNDQRLGFRAPKITISEKLSLGKRKMEEAKQFLTPMVSHLSRPINGVASPGLGKNVSVANKLISTEVTSVSQAGSHLRPKMMLNGAASQGTGVPANSSANYYAGSWSTQPQSTLLFGSAPTKNVPIQSSVRVRDPSFRPFTSQTPHGTFPVTNQPMQGVHYGQTSSFQNNHSDIAKIIYNLLHPRVRQYPVWNPPSRDYMSSAMTCQMCEVTITEVETLLICDACEKAYHLKCLQANNLKGIPKSEWHCSRCVHASNGKPFPPKYGRAVTTATAKKVGSMDTKVNLQKPIVTTGPRGQNSPSFVSGAATTSHSESARVNANTIASAAKTTNTGTQSFRESLIRCTNSSALVSLTKTPNPTAVANNGFISKPLAPVGTISSTSPLPVGNLVTVNTYSNASLSRPSLVAEAPSVTETGDKCSSASGTTDHSILNAELTTQSQALTVISSGNPQPEVSQSETAKASEDAAIGQGFNADDGLEAPMENISMCENPSESTSRSDSLNNKTIQENGQESSKDASEKLASKPFQKHPTETPTAVESDQDSKMTAEPSMPKENSAYQTEKTASQTPSVSSNYHSQTEKETPNAQDTVQNSPGDSQEGKGF
ncbi:hypothetical protein N665_0182s0074 [Sinapis alba]|nr:hypothetical protein N665_0182s0074 [Sinapis alba]